MRLLPEGGIDSGVDVVEAGELSLDTFLFREADGDFDDVFFLRPVVGDLDDALLAILGDAVSGGGGGGGGGGAGMSPTEFPMEDFFLLLDGDLDNARRPSNDCTTGAGGISPVDPRLLCLATRDLDSPGGDISPLLPPELP